MSDKFEARISTDEGGSCCLLVLVVAVMVLTKASPAHSEFPPVRPSGPFPTHTIPPGIHHQIRPASYHGQGEGNHRWHRARTHRISLGHIFTPFFFQGRKLLRQDNPGKVSAKDSAWQYHHPPGRTPTSYLQHNWRSSLSFWFLGFCSGQHRSMHLVGLCGL